MLAVPLFYLSVVCALMPLANGAPEVKLGETTIIGRDVTLLKQDFFGVGYRIPFAEPPLGNLRLKPPVLKTDLKSKTFDASNFGFSCLQDNAIPVGALSEDCLTINIFRPSGYGSGFIKGASNLYNGSALVAQSVARGTPIIYVNFNYRLGPLGFPQGEEGGSRADQLAALEWVQHNIGVFGGDKTKVTVFGESAGSIMTAILFLNSPIDKLARAAIFESGSAATSLNFNAEHREVSWANFVGSVLKCSSLTGTKNTFDCLRTANTSDILQGVVASLSKANESLPFDPTIDGPGGLMPDTPSRLFKRGKFARLPFIAGTNLDEASALEEASAMLLELYPDDPALGSPFNTGNDTFGLSSVFKQAAAIQGDLLLQSQRRFWIQTASDAGVKTFGYLFTEPQAVTPLQPAFFGVSHGSDVAFVYGDVPNPTPSASKLSSMMMDYWISFATSLDPNDGLGNGRPIWSQYTPKNQVRNSL
ncbi:Alpha/Beta hydrolase protein [Infundibulicybe gibba]|nr:Alpha/Beta hydrolase protein [Infundibulicybe gibba]